MGCIKIVSLLKKIYVYARTAIKLISLVLAGTVLIGIAIVAIYKPIYKVSLNGSDIGYCQDKDKLQSKINNYMKTGNEGEKNIAFVQIDDMPEYQMCLQKKGIYTNDEEIFNQIKATGVIYYRYYSILDDGEEKAYVASFEEAEGTISELKEKNSNNISDLTISERYETELPTLISKSDAINKLFEKKPVVVSTKKYAATGSVTSSSRALNYEHVNLGITLIRPVSGVLTSRYGYRWGRTHTGIDIGSSNGTTVVAAAGGTVTFSGWKGELGNLVVITHSNGVQTYYGHCSKLYVTAGQTVSAGQAISAVGSTGKSTGPHLHFEIRINGSSINPQSYIGY